MRMDLDLDAFLETTAAEWDYAVVVGGRRFPTRPITAEDVGAFAAIGRRATEAQGAGLSGPQMIEVGASLLADTRALVAGLFVDPRPDLAGVPINALLRILSGAVSYWGQIERRRAAGVRRHAKIGGQP